MVKHLTIKVMGKVQGVGFRYSAMLEAENLGLSGFAQNLPDGAVLIESEGEEENLDRFVLWCHQGPELAQVDRVVVKEGQVKNYPNFEIK